MIARELRQALLEAAAVYPVVTVTGPRQSGKTTLCRATFPGKPYVSLEPLDVRRHATEDPRSFLQEHAAGAIFDEVQNAPELFNYLQVDVDERPAPGRFILTGSQHFGLTGSVSQTLAGRTAVLHLLPPDYAELRQFETAPRELLAVLCQGAYPRIYDRNVPAHRWLADYVATYVQRDVRQVLNVTDLEAFTAFARHCAGRTACEVNLSRLGADAGVTHNTARAWLSVLEASFICFRVPAWHRNVRKQFVKAPKLHFVDSGLACHLLGITEPDHLRHHPLRGAIFESWVASEILKWRTHRGLEAALHHVRTAKGLEADLLVETGAGRIAVEAKSGVTVPADATADLRLAVETLLPQRASRPAAARIVYGGDSAHHVAGIDVVPWQAVGDVSWDPAAPRA